MTDISLERTSERDELLDLLLAQGILRRSETQPVLSRDGTSARWMLDSLSVTLTARGCALAGRLMLDRLQSFDGRQLATYGLTAVPILQSAILQSAGRYHGLLVRRERKPHGSRKLIEGRVETDEPTIVIEDSIASGTSVSEGIATLEAAGLRVEGCVALVRFGWEGGCSNLRERGYHVECIFDIFEDFMTRMEGERGQDHNPTKSFTELPWSQRPAPEKLHPAHLARAVLREYCSSGELLRPPMRLDRDDYDSSGGAWVSLRSKDDMYERHARDGFWHFPDEPSWGTSGDIVRAAFRTVRTLPDDAERLKRIESSFIAVTLFSVLGRVVVGELDNDRYGIVVVSGERPDVMGGALPRMPGIRDEWQQLHHARHNNAALDAFEPYTIYRHEVSKFVEPGAPWPSSGVARNHDIPNLSAAATWARELARGRFPQQGLPESELPSTIARVFVTIYVDGQVRGCMGAEIGDLQEDLRELTRAALVDDRFEDIPIDDDSTLAVSVSLLYNELEMGDFSPEEVRVRYRHGQQALGLEQGARAGLLLPFVTSWMSLDAEDFVNEVIDKAGVTRPTYNWRRFDCVTWLADEDGSFLMEGALKRCPPGLAASEVAEMQTEYMLRNQRSDGSFYFSYYPFENTLYQGIDAARQAHGAWTLARVGRAEASMAALQKALNLPEEPPLTLSRDAFVLLAFCETGFSDQTGKSALAEKLLASIDRHGRVATWQPPPPSSTACDDRELEESSEGSAYDTIDPEELQNYVPGQVLLALAAAARKGLVLEVEKKVARALRYYRHRFRYRRDFGQVSWMALASAAWSRSARNREWAEFVFEIADWILEFQQAKTGAFLTDHQPDTPGYTTAVYLEAIGAAVHVAREFDAAQHAHYEESWRRGFAFLDRLIIQERDSSVLPNPDYAFGGVRENLYSGHVRIDFVHHSVSAILERYPDLVVPKSTNQEN